MNRVFSGHLILLGAALLLLSNSAPAQTGDKPAALPKSVSLPRSFVRFSPGDVLKLIFSGYDPATGRVSGILNTERKPAFVQIDEAGLWKVQGQDHLVVLVGINSDDDASAGVCGNCIGNSFLAVLKKSGAALSLVAKQLTPPSSGEPVEYESLDQDEVISISGHDSVSLDLAPYKLNSRETLIGFRQEHIWLPTSDWWTILTLYRIEGGRLTEVFTEKVVERVYPAASDRGRRIIDKTVSAISLAPPARPAGGGFNEMAVRKTTVECFDENNDEDCDPKHEAVRPLKTLTEVWRFDGRRYVRAPTARR
ncbi:MAG TPA: hypothetical protein VF611_18680 [Pyrinomonadaceae bacterium]